MYTNIEEALNTRYAIVQKRNGLEGKEYKQLSKELYKANHYIINKLNSKEIEECFLKL